MKKFFMKGVLFCTALLFSAQAEAQINLGNILKNVVSGKTEKTETTNSSDESKSSGLLSALTSVFSGDKGSFFF